MVRLSELDGEWGDSVRAFSASKLLFSFNILVPDLLGIILVLLLQTVFILPINTLEFPNSNGRHARASKLLRGILEASSKHDRFSPCLPPLHAVR